MIAHQLMCSELPHPPFVLETALRNMSTATPTPLSESALEKAALAIEKLEGRGNWPLWSVNIELVLDHTWEYVEGGQSTPPNMSKPEYATWLAADSPKDLVCPYQ